MIDKQEASENGLKILENTNKDAQKLEQLKKLIPNLVNSDKQLDITALEDFIDIANTTSNNKGYELTFAGKGLARAKADSETPFELKTEKGQSKNFDQTKNAVIRGDNLEVLKILKQNYYGKIKMIYIDPPYNTKSENFIYNDNFQQNENDLLKTFGLDEKDEDDKNTLNFLHNIYGTRSHSGWLAFMYPRLKLARELLKEDGVIFISIDDNEQANLKILCDEIFGEENFCAGLVHQKKSGGGQANFYYKGHDTILVYAKNKINISGLYKRDGKKLKTIKIDGIEHWYDTDLIRRVHGKYNSKDGHRNLFYEDLDGEKKKKIDIDLADKKYILIKDDQTDNHYVSKYGLLNDKKKLFYSILQSDSIYNLWSSYGDDRLVDLFSRENLFTNPKSADLLKLFLCNTQPNDIILDFFAGSGTTGDAVMQLNKEDGGARKFILVQWDEQIKENSEAYKFCTENNFEPFISSITLERLNRAGEKIRKTNELVDIGYKVFSLTEKPQIVENEDTKLFTMENQRSSAENTLYNMLCATCKTLDSKMIELKKDILYLVDDEMYLLGNIPQDELEEYKNYKINLDGWGDIDLENWLNWGFGNKKNKENVNVVY